MTVDDLKGAEIRLYVRISKGGMVTFFCCSERGSVKSQWSTSDLSYIPLDMAKRIIASLTQSVVTALELLPRFRFERVGRSSWNLFTVTPPSIFLPSDIRPPDSPQTTGS